MVIYHAIIFMYVYTSLYSYNAVYIECEHIVPSYQCTCTVDGVYMPSQRVRTIQRVRVQILDPA
jgi:hypothetical protein